jgi:hypothetical protein
MNLVRGLLSSHRQSYGKASETRLSTSILVHNCARVLGTCRRALALISGGAGASALVS